MPINQVKWSYIDNVAELSMKLWKEFCIHKPAHWDITPGVVDGNDYLYPQNGDNGDQIAEIFKKCARIRWWSSSLIRKSQFFFEYMKHFQKLEKKLDIEITMTTSELYSEPKIILLICFSSLSCFAMVSTGQHRLHSTLRFFYLFHAMKFLFSWI